MRLLNTCTNTNYMYDVSYQKPMIVILVFSDFVTCFSCQDFSVLESVEWTDGSLQSVASPAVLCLNILEALCRHKYMNKNTGMKVEINSQTVQCMLAKLRQTCIWLRLQKHCFVRTLNLAPSLGHSQFYKCCMPLAFQCATLKNWERPGDEATPNS